MHKLFKKSLLTSLVLTAPIVAQGAAFQLSETSVAGLGRAFAGEAAVADNASVVATNPALMTQFKRPMASLGLIVFMPNIDVKGTALSKLLKVEAVDNNIAPVKVVPQSYFVYPVTDNFAIGGGLNVNYGLSTKYSKDFAGGYAGGYSNLEVLNANVSGAYRIGGFSVGLGLNVIYARAEIDRYLGALAGKFNKFIPNLQPTQALAKLEGDDWAVGGNIGISYDFNENNRIGLAYHSPIRVTFKGTYQNDMGKKPGILNFFPGLENILRENGLIFTDGKVLDAQVKITLPEYVEFGGSHNLTSRFNLSYGVKWTHWRRFKELKAINPNNGQTLFVKKEYFKDSWRYAIGASYLVNEQLTLRTGIAYDTSAADKHKSISIPDTDRTWLTLGATYNVTKDLSVDTGVAYIWGKKSKFIEDEGKVIESEFEVNASAVLVGLNLNYQF